MGLPRFWGEIEFSRSPGPFLTGKRRAGEEQVLGSTYRLRRRCMYIRQSMGAPSTNRRLSRIFKLKLPLPGKRRDDPHRVDQPGYVSEYRQEYVAFSLNDKSTSAEILGSPSGVTLTKRLRRL